MIRQWQEDRVSGLAAEVAFFSLLALFPTVLALTAALGSLEAVVGAEAATRMEDAVLDALRKVLTAEASGTVDAVQALFEEPSPGLLTVGLLAAVWGASRAFAAVIGALDVAYDLGEHRGYLSRRLLAMGMALASVVVGVVVLAMVVIGPLLGTGVDVAERLGAGEVTAALWDLARWPFVLVLLVGWASWVFHVGPNHRTPWRWDLPGAVLTTLLWVAASLGLRLYLALVPGSNQVFGTVGGILIAVVWLYLLALALLVGAELNAILAVRHDVVQMPRRLPSADELSVLRSLRRRWDAWVDRRGWRLPS